MRKKVRISDCLRVVFADSDWLGNLVQEERDAYEEFALTLLTLADQRGWDLVKMTERLRRMFEKGN